MRPAQHVLPVREKRSVRAAALILTVLLAGTAGAQATGLKGEVVVGGTGSALGLMHKLGEEFRKTHPDVQFKVLPSLGSGGGIKALEAGLLTVSVSSRPLTAREQAKGLSAEEIAKTPLVVVAGPGTATRNLTIKQLAALYSGATSTWPNGKLVRPVLRPLEDIDTRVLQSMSPEMAKSVALAHERPGRNIAVTDSESADELERIPGAIGTSTLALIKSENRTLQPLSVEGVHPLAGPVPNPKYPYQKSIYLVTPPQPSPLAKAFVRFTNSPKALQILARNGTTPVASDK